jgi:hypothetical protein
VTVLPGALNIAMSHADRAPPCIYRATPPLRNPNVQNSERLHEKDVGPTRGFTASPGVGSGATVDTLKTRYPCVQALSQDERQDRRVCRLRGAPELPRASWPWLPSPRSGQLQSRHVSHGSSSHHQAPGQLRDRQVPPRLQLLPPGSGQLRSCPVSRGWALRDASY